MCDSSRQPSDDFHLLGFAHMFIHPLALGRVHQHRDQEGGFASRVAPQRHRQMSPELGTVFAPVAFFAFDRAALAPHQLAQRSFAGQKIAGINFAANFALNLRTNCRINFRKEIASLRAGQFLRAVAQHSAERGIRFQNLPIEPANPDANRGPFKHCLEAQFAVVIVGRRKLGQNVHADTTPQEFSPPPDRYICLRSGETARKCWVARPIADHCDSKLGKASATFPRMNRASLIREECSAKLIAAKCQPSHQICDDSGDDS